MSLYPSGTSVFSFTAPARCAISLPRSKCGCADSHSSRWKSASASTYGWLPNFFRCALSSALSAVKPSAGFSAECYKSVHVPSQRGLCRARLGASACTHSRRLAATRAMVHCVASSWAAVDPCFGALCEHCRCHTGRWVDMRKEPHPAAAAGSRPGTRRGGRPRGRGCRPV